MWENSPDSVARVSMLGQMGKRVYRFGEFELSEAEAELRTKEGRVPLQEKPLLLLLVLLENPLHIVTREQLRERMWDGNTFVDYEQGINVAIKKVRDALGDSAEKPKFIETIAKKGYRFLASVEVSGHEIGASTLIASQPLAIDPPTGNAPHGIRRLKHHGWILAALVTAILFAFGFWFFGSRGHPARPTAIRSLAVLPLQNLSPDSGQEYFADGITEELITNLAQSLPLRVISRTSVMRYRQTNEPVSQIARELGVEAIVEGAVTRSGQRVVVTVQLIDAIDDRHLWAQKYDRDVGDILNMEAELSQEIASQVGATLSARSSTKAANSRSVDPQVYELCLLGRYHWNKRTAEGLSKSAEYYQQAIARDPTYAPAYAGLADAYALLPAYDSVRLRDTYALADATARHAVELDETLAEAHATLALIGLNYGTWNPAQEEEEFRRALELNPNYATAHHWFAFYLVFRGRSNEALAEIERARQLDPLSAVVNADEGFFLYGARHFPEARIRLQRAFELAPDFGQPHATLALIELESGQPSEALHEASVSLALDPMNPHTIGEAAYVLAMAGRAAEARKLLAAVQDMVRRGSASPSYVALIEIGLGKREAALSALKELKKQNVGAVLPGLVQWHAFDELRTDSRYQQLLAEAGQ